MSDRDEENGKGFKVTDKRRFIIDEEGNVKGGEVEGAQEDRPGSQTTGAEGAEVPPETKEVPEEAPESKDAGKKSLRERIMDKLSGEKGSEADAEAPKGGREDAPEIDFGGFVFSLSSSVMFHFGEIEDPVTGQKQTNLPAAKQTIDILGMLAEKTKGNLTKEEEQLLKAILYDLRMRYVDLTKKTS